MFYEITLFNCEFISSRLMIFRVVIYLLENNNLKWVIYFDQIINK